MSTDTRFALQTYERRCEKGHKFSSGDVAARWTNKKGNVRYWCPVCLQKGKLPPKEWRKVNATITTGAPQ